MKRRPHGYKKLTERYSVTNLANWLTPEQIEQVAIQVLINKRSKRKTRA